MISLIAFLGNYGREYEKTRHNTAWQFADTLPFAGRLVWQEKFKGLYTVVETVQLIQWFYDAGLIVTKNGTPPSVVAGAAEKIYFLKPLTYMNLSGESIGELARFYKIKPEEILVVHDELELPVGTVSLKWSGGLGGHNGLRSIKAVLGTADFWRLRFGISKPDGKDIAEYVLNEFSPDEKIILSQAFPQTAGLLSKIILSGDPSRLVTEWGKKKLSAE
jgi:peptidyl-tRNA hydrolase, PTH1 family